MRYDYLPHDTAKRVLDAFYGHDMCINKAFEKFRNPDTYWSSDRERFVGKFFKKYAGKHIVIIDREIIGYNYNNFFSFCNPLSVYSTENKEHYFNGEAVIRKSRKYLAITGFRAINEMYGRGYIEMSCYDVFGNKFGYRIDQYTLSKLQFRELTEAEFKSVADLFTDDRDDLPFKVTRFITRDEAKEKKIKVKRGEIPRETVTVYAKDDSDAMKMVENAVEAVPEEK